VIVRGEFDGIGHGEDLLNFYKKLPYQDGSSSFCRRRAFRFPGTNRQQFWHVMRTFLEIAAAPDGGKAG